MQIAMDVGLRGTIPPNGWVLPETVKDYSIGNNQQAKLNKIFGPIPPTWKLPTGAVVRHGSLHCA